MKQLLEFIPLILFFVVYKFYGTQEAAIVLIIATIIQLILLKILFGKVEKMQCFLAQFILIFGGITAYTNDPKYLQWKVSIVNGLFAFVLLFSQFVLKNPLIKYVLGKEISLPNNVWRKINFGWAMFFIFCLLLNLYISQFMSLDAWFTFKTFGLTGLSLLATVITAIYLYPHLKTTEDKRGE